MSYETVRISELAKELGLPSKEVVEKFAKIGITGKTHSSTVTVDQISRLKDFIANGSVKPVQKPKAFVVKKAKPEPAAVVEEKKETSAEVKKPVIERVSRIEKVERPKVEVVKPASRLEIVRRAPKKPVGEDSRPSRPYNRDDKKFPPRGDKPAGDRKINRGDKPAQSGENKDFANKKPLQRRIISQEIYDNKTPAPSSKRRVDTKKKEKDFNSKKEEQERISLEKAAAQHHKKKVQKVEAVEEVTKIVVNQAMTISEIGRASCRERV